jgi:predicted GIY-YIG superfamily endonuclease
LIGNDLGPSCGAVAPNVDASAAPVVRRPTRLLYQEVNASRSAALKREAAIKGLSRRQKESLIQLAG